jgi:hypothetical protein
MTLTVINKTSSRNCKDDPGGLVRWTDLDLVRGTAFLTEIFHHFV